MNLGLSLRIGDNSTTTNGGGGDDGGGGGSPTQLEPTSAENITAMGGSGGAVVTWSDPTLVPHGIRVIIYHDNSVSADAVISAGIQTYFSNNGYGEYRAELTNVSDGDTTYVDSLTQQVGPISDNPPEGLMSESGTPLNSESGSPLLPE